MEKCPLTKEDCAKTDCAWFKDGECATAALVSTLDLMLDDVIQSVKSLEETIKNIDFQM